MQRPLIGITADQHAKPDKYELPVAYPAAVELAGGLPLVIPYRLDLSLIPQLVQTLDGIIFSGGNDLSPQPWGEPRHPNTSPIDPARELFERALLAEVERRRLPTLGICLGCQLMNVHRGGSLIQFLPDLPRQPMIEHRRLNPPVDPRHPVKLVDDSTVAKLLGKTELSANSSHKQAVKTLGRNLRVTATAPDGVIEGLEDPSLPLFVGVQWHPERLHEEAEHLALFKLLVEKSRDIHASRR